MNTKLIALAAALCVASCTQATYVSEKNFSTTWPDKFESAEYTRALSEALKGENFNKAFTAQAQFERTVQTAVLTSGAAIIAGLLGCAFAEWYQEFKVRKAQKATLIARLQCEAAQTRAYCRVA